MTTSHLKESLNKMNPRIQNRILYLVYETVIKDHDKLKNFINEQTGHKYKTFDIYDVKDSDNIKEPHTVALFELNDILDKRNGYDLFDYDGNKPSIYKVTKSKAELVKAYCRTKEIRVLNSLDDLFKTVHSIGNPDDEEKEGEKKKTRKKPIEVPLAFHDYTDHFPTIELKLEPVYSSGNKPLKMRIDNYLPGLNLELGHDYIFLTVCFLPSQVTPFSAWQLIPHLENQIANILFGHDEIKYILSGIEIHTSKDDSRKKDKDSNREKDNKKTKKDDNTAKKKKVTIKIKKEESSDENSDEDSEESTPSTIKTLLKPPIKTVPKTESKKEKEEDSKKLADDSMELLLVTHNKYVHRLDENTGALEEVLRVFRMYDENLDPAVVIEENYTETIVKRAIKYAKKIDLLKFSEWPTKYDNPKVLSEYATAIYYQLQSDGGNVVKYKPDKLIGYPHIHMAIARSKNEKTGEFDDLSKYYQALCQPTTIFSDIYIKDSMGRAGKVPKTKTLSDTSASNILAYCLKNSLHKIVHQNLGRPPCTFYNPHKLEKPNKFFDNLIRNNKIIINGVKPCSSTPLEVKQHKEYDKDTKKFIEAKDKLTAFMKKKNYKVCYDGIDVSIWTKIEGSRNSWQELPEKSKLEDLWMEFIEDGNHNTRKYKRDLLDLMASRSQKSYPQISLDYQTIEFGDFFLHFNVGTFSEVDPKNPSFYYNPKYKLDEYINDTIKTPNLWLEILRNSGYIKPDDSPTTVGKKLLKMLYQLLLPKLHKRKTIGLLGPPNSCKTSLYAPLLRIYPMKKIGVITSSNGFESSTYDRKEILDFDEINLKTLGINQDTLKRILEGDVQMSINYKNTKIFTTNVKSRSIVSGNNMDAFSVGGDQYRNIKFAHSPIRNNPKSSEKEMQNYVVKKYDIDIALAQRMVFFTLTSLPEEKLIEDGKNVIIRRETGAIILYLAKLYGKTKHYTDLHELHETIADEYENCINRTITAAE